MKILRDFCKRIVDKNITLNRLYLRIRSYFQNISLRIKPDKRTFLARQYLRGKGIEIGALHLPLVLPGRAHVNYVDRMTVEELRKQYPELRAYPLVEPVIIDDGENIAKIRLER